MNILKLHLALAALLPALLSIGCDAKKPDAKPSPAAAPSPGTGGAPNSNPTSTHAPATTAAPPAALVPGSITFAPLSPRSAGSPKMFTRLSPAACGIDMTSPIAYDHPLKFLYASSMACGGVAIGDVDGDGLPDIFIASGPGKNRLYIQTAPMQFKDVAAAAGVDGGDSWGNGCAIVDIDGDGDMDIFVCNYDSPNQLFINQGGMKFTEEAGARGLEMIDSSHTPAFCDFDGDGNLDLYVLTNRYYNRDGYPTETAMDMVGGKAYVLPKYEKFYAPVKISETEYRLDVVGRPDRLFRNDGKGVFKDVTAEAGIKHRGHGLSATWFDYDNDGRIDLFVANDFDEPDQYYHNNGDGTFTQFAQQAVRFTSWFSMGADFADVNNDGLFDFFVADMFPRGHQRMMTNMGGMDDKLYFRYTADPPQLMRNVFQINAGGGRFMEAAFMMGLGRTDWTWAVKMEDLDCDGKVDVYITNGMSRNFNEKDATDALQRQPGKTQWDRYAKLPPMKEQNLAYRNAGDLRFEDVSKAWGLDHVGMTYGAAYGDLDRDGDIDIVSVNLDEEVHLHRNDAATGNRLLVKLQSGSGDKRAIGARLTIHTPAGLQTRQLTLARGYMGSDEPIAHFGLGDQTKIDKLTILWPDGRQQEAANLEAGRIYTITQAADAPIAKAPTLIQPLFKLLSPSQTDIGARHKERIFNDYKRQPLLPRQLSQLGPGIAVGDLNGDGREDIYIGGASGGAAWHYLAKADGSFDLNIQQAIAADSDHEDMGALFFDADSDGDLDLYVVSGSVEPEPGSPLLRDRLYLNDGKGNFQRAPADALPDLRDSGGPVIAADFDHDGDLDLFIGSRSIPGQYPLSPDSRLLRNDKGKFTDITDQVAPGLRQAGMVTGAVWSDADGDGWPELLLTLEWGPVKIFKNRQGKLVEATREAGLEPLTGWWNSIAAGDLNNDGAMDYIVTNFGLNTRFAASQAHPLRLYYGDIEKSGVMQIIEGEYEDGKLYPTRFLSEVRAVMPSLEARYKTWQSYAQATLEEIHTPEALAEARMFHCATLESGVLINDGKGKFSFKPLPRLAQISPGFGVVVTDVDADGKMDIYIAQNFYQSQIEVGRMGSGLSLLLKGKGDGTFDPVWPNLSGLFAGVDGRSLAVADFNADGRPDFLLAPNNDRPLLFLNQSTAGAPIAIRLKANPAKPGNPTAIGAQVKVMLADGATQTAEVHAGSGYLSQSSPTLHFGAGTSTLKEIQVRWPDGKTTTHKPQGPLTKIVIDQPN